MWPILQTPERRDPGAANGVSGTMSAVPEPRLLEPILVGVATSLVKAAILKGVGPTAARTFSVIATFYDVGEVANCLLARADASSLGIAGSRLLIGQVSSRLVDAALGLRSHSFQARGSDDGLWISSTLIDGGQLSLGYHPQLVVRETLSLRAIESVLTLGAPPRALAGRTLSVSAPSMQTVAPPSLSISTDPASTRRRRS